MVRAYVLISATAGKALEVATKLHGQQGIVNADAITGEYDVIAQVESRRHRRHRQADRREDPGRRGRVQDHHLPGDQIGERRRPPREPSGLAGLLRESVGRLRASPRLRRSLFGWLALGLVAAEAFSLSVAQVHGGGRVVAGLLTLAGWLVVSLAMAGGAALLVRPDGSRVDVYGVPNGLSAIRAWLCPSLLFCTGWTLPGRLGLLLWIFVGGSVGMLDAVDGWVARRFGPVTQLGKAIDPATDALYFSVAAIASLWLGIFTWWLMALVVFRYLAPLLLTPDRLPAPAPPGAGAHPVGPLQHHAHRAGALRLHAGQGGRRPGGPGQRGRRPAPARPHRPAPLSRSGAAGGCSAFGAVTVDGDPRAGLFDAFALEVARIG